MARRIEPVLHHLGGGALAAGDVLRAGARVAGGADAVGEAAAVAAVVLDVAAAAMSALCASAALPIRASIRRGRQPAWASALPVVELGADGRAAAVRDGVGVAVGLAVGARPGFALGVADAAAERAAEGVVVTIAPLAGLPAARSVTSAAGLLLSWAVAAAMPMPPRNAPQPERAWRTALPRLPRVITRR